MEVHQPDHPLHSWGDFLNHMATLTLGLLLALLLEAGAERMHHLNERHDLEDELRQEAVNNQKILEADYRFYDGSIAWSLAMQSDLSALAAGSKKDAFVYRLPPDQTADVSPSQAVWTAAKDSGEIALLPRAEAQMYARVYHQHDTMLEFHQKFRDVLFERESFECAFSVNRYPCAPDLSHLNAQDRQKYFGLLAAAAIASYDMKLRIDHVYGADTAVLGGAQSEDDVLKSIEDTVIRHRRTPQGMETGGIQ
jgi:hypothetical protein